MDIRQLDAYAGRLRTWNDSPKYRAELRFLWRLLDPKPHERILDIGCGTGACVQYIAAHSEASVDGFDVNRLVDGSPAWYRDRLDDAGRYDKIYFLHSLAHIPDAPEVLARVVRDHLTSDGRLYVVTPNADFDEYLRSLPRSTPYVPDPTVHRHYTRATLTALLDGAGLDVTIAGYAGKREGGHHERLFAVAIRTARDGDAWSRTY
ncbi:MAG: cyclopropane-fatty-acyl-phospholipid synthase family protein [Vicinamibacterales bacterium]